MKWMIFAILAELGVLLCLIFAFDEALHSIESMRATWDHAAVLVIYAVGRIGFSRMRTLPTGGALPARRALPPGRVLPSGS
jgi:hypothetical protein